MKRFIFQNYLILLLVLTSITANAQTVSVPDITSGGSSFGTEILVPINTTDISASHGDIIIATLGIEYDETILSYAGYDNLNPALSGLAISVNPAGANGVVRFNIEEESFAGITWPDGKVLDVKFIFNGGNTSININPAEFLSSVFDEIYPPVINGSVSGFADITASNGDYNDKTIWAGEFGTLTKPGLGHNVTITAGGTVTIATEAVANSLTIADGGKLTQNAALSVTQDFTMQSGGSFLQNGVLTAANTKAERAVPVADWNTALNGWSQISSPVANQAIDGEWIPEGVGNDYDFYAWDEPADIWRNQKYASTSGYDFTAFNLGQGYMAAYQAGGTKTFNGVFNTADVPVTLTKQGSDEGTKINGFNLLGNPYPVAITWNNSWVTGDMEGAARVWSGSSYVPIELDEAIPAMTGFMVLANSDGANITIPAAARAHSAVSFKTTVPGIKLIAKDLEVGSQQETRIRFNEQATESYDLAYDAYYLSGYAPQLYTIAGQTPLMVNSLPVLQEDTKIPLNFEKTEAGNFSIQLTENSLSVPVYLKDLKLNTTVKLSEIMEYHFTAEAGDSPDRFEVFFSALGVEKLTQDQAGAFVRNNNIVVYGLNESTSIELYNLAGQLVFATQASGSTSQVEINAGLKQGVYIVKLFNQAAANSVKVFIP